MNDANEKTRMNRRHTIMTIANLANLASRAPIAYELLHRIGLERRRSRAIRAASCAGWIGVGMAVGSGLTLLLTPRSGPEMREYLGERAKRARDYVVTNGIEPAGRASAAQAS
jgi:hypothetical protein